MLRAIRAIRGITRITQTTHANRQIKETWGWAGGFVHAYIMCSARTASRIMSMTARLRVWP